MSFRNVGDGWVMITKPGRRFASEKEAVRVILLLAAIGMPWQRERHGYEEWFGWNGKALRLNEPTGDLLHEMAHWMLAPPSERCRTDFGLEQGGGRPNDREEQLVSLFGILLERALGLPWADNFYEHNWNKSPSGRRHTLARLRELGLVDDMTPTLLRPLRRLPS